MSEKPSFVLLDLPTSFGGNIDRGYAGGFGIVGRVPEEILLPIHLLYGASALDTSECKYSILDAQAMGYNRSQTLEIIKRNKPDIIISWISLPSIHSDLNLLDEFEIKARPRSSKVDDVVPAAAGFRSSGPQ